MHISHISVINWVKKAEEAEEEICKRRKFKQKKTNILEFDEMCKKNKKIWLWTAVSNKAEKFVGFFLGDRSFVEIFPNCLYPFLAISTYF